MIKVRYYGILSQIAGKIRCGEPDNIFRASFTFITLMTNDHIERPTKSSEEIKKIVDESKEACGHFKERYGKCYKNWQRTSLMRGGDMRYVCEEFYDEFRACIVENLAGQGIHDVPFFGVSSPHSGQ